MPFTVRPVGLAFLALALAPSVAAQPAVQDRLVDDDGVHLALRCSGARQPGQPLVLLHSGGDGEDYYDTWRDVLAPLAELARVCAHGGPRRGTSGYPFDQLTPAGYVELVRQGLQVAAEPPPYLLVGHSAGGLRIQMYAVRYPDDVAGLVFIDAAHEQLWRRRAALPERWSGLTDLARRHAPRRPAPSFAPHLYRRPEWPQSLQIPPTFAEAVQQTPWRGTVPIFVLTGAKTHSLPGSGPHVALRMELHRDVASRSPNSRHVVSENSGHHIQNDEPRLVVDAVAWVLNQ